MKVAFTAGKRAGTHAEVDESTGRWLLKHNRAEAVADDSAPDPGPVTSDGDDGETRPKRGRPRGGTTRAKDAATSGTSD